MDDQAGFDGLAQTYLVGQQHARGDAVGDLLGNVQLVRDGLCTHATQAPQRGLQLGTLVLQGVVAQAEPGQRVDLAGEEAVAGQAELDEVRQLGFRQGAGFVLRGQAVIDQQAIDVIDLAHGHLPTFEVGDLVSRDEAYAGQWRTARRILAGLAGRRVKHGEHPSILSEDGSEAEFRLAVADPALPR